ncbi:MAG: hypothetical protein ACPGSB_05675 [Opitutales bacterium]
MKTTVVLPIELLELSQFEAAKRRTHFKNFLSALHPKAETLMNEANSFDVLSLT